MGNEKCEMRRKKKDVIRNTKTYRQKNKKKRKEE